MIPSIDDVEVLALDYLESNPSANAPYHNNAHMTKVASIAGALWQHERVELEFDNKWADIVLMLAALFHDYDHSQGKDTDHSNVTRARGCAKVFVMEHVPEMPESAVAALDAAIECTEYPFTIIPRNKLEEVLRDADLLYAVVSSDPSIIMDGLRKEIETSLGRTVSYEEMAENQVEFLKQQYMFTPTAQEYWLSEVESFTDAIINYNKEDRPMDNVTIRNFTMTRNALNAFGELDAKKSISVDGIGSLSAMKELIDLGLCKVDPKDKDSYVLTKLGEYEAGLYFTPSQTEEELAEVPED